jgi:ParB/RepB/Spo0J family partition protein
MTEDRSRQRLGRGLAALIGSGGAAPARTSSGFAPIEATGERKIAVALLSPNPRNPRRYFDETDLADLSASIRTHGVVQPILVRAKEAVPGEFEIVAGERRWRAAQKAGLSEVPVVVREISDRESLEIAIIENVQRADLSAIEEAQAYQMLIEEHGYTQADLADVLGKSRSHVANTLRLLKLPDGVRGMLARGELSPGHARTAVSADHRPGPFRPRSRGYGPGTDARGCRAQQAEERAAREAGEAGARAARDADQREGRGHAGAGAALVGDARHARRNPPARGRWGPAHRLRQSRTARRDLPAAAGQAKAGGRAARAHVLGRSRARLPVNGICFKHVFRHR